jgi:DNA-binding transcriptional LysR family regulator
MLDLRRLRLLRELRERGTIAAVADALAYTPSAVSQQLAQLEREAGVALLERVGRGVRLTDAALGLVEHTEVVLARLEQAEAELTAVGGTVQGVVRIAAFQTAARGLVLPILRPLADTHPRLRCELVEMEAEEALGHLRVGDLDIVVAEEYADMPRPRDAALERVAIAQDDIVVALPAGHPAAERERVRLRELAGEPWVTTRAGTLFGDVVLRACRSIGGFEPDVRHRANDVEVLLQLAADGHGIAMVPMLGQPDREAGIDVRPIAGGDIHRLIFAAVRRGGAERPSVAVALEALRAQAVHVGLGPA